MVPYYREIFDRLHLKPSDIRRIEDLEKLPILTKSDIKRNFPMFTPKNLSKLKYYWTQTGGSTGEPLRYRRSDEDRERARALHLRNLGYGGYNLGDKIAVFAGGSLIPSHLQQWKRKILELGWAERFYSSYDMSKENLEEYIEDINEFRPKFIYGYATSVYLLAKFIKENDLKLSFQPKAIFTTSEVLLESQRRLIEEVFQSDVYDCYSLNDGGISAYECDEHIGMHIDTERAILEVVDEEGKQIIGKEGRILATSLYNFAFPFIRYDTGDIGIIVDNKCSCGRQTLILKELKGRTTDYLCLNGVIIGSPVLTLVMGRLDVEQYQIIQKSQNSIVFNIVKGKTYSQNDEEFIRKSLISHVGPIEISFNYVDVIVPHGGNKHKFIINETCESGKGEVGRGNQA
jgi:phenylacetate-CoA ligase